MKTTRRLLLVTLVAAAASALSPAPAHATEACGSGHVDGFPLPLPSCTHCPPGASVGPSGPEPWLSVYVCVTA